MSKIRVMISGLIYPVTMMRFFWEELERREDIELFSCGPFFDDWIPWKGGMHLPRKYVKTPTFPLSREMASYRVHSDMLKGLIPDGLDLWIQVDAGFHFSVRPPAKKVVLVETDPHVLKSHYSVPEAYSDLVFCMQTPYMSGSDHWLPYACDTNRFYPEEREMVYDACIIGLQYQQRTDLVNRLRSGGKKVFYENGLVFDEYREIYNSSKIALSWSSMDDTPVRVFEAMGMMRPLVANRTPDLLKLFDEGTHFLGFNTLDEAERHVNFLLENPEFAKKMAKAGYNEVIANHTWKHRINDMLNVLGVR